MKGSLKQTQEFREIKQYVISYHEHSLAKVAAVQHNIFSL